MVYENFVQGLKLQNFFLPTLVFCSEALDLAFPTYLIFAHFNIVFI
jgi:hypothetical protein